MHDDVATMSGVPDVSTMPYVLDVSPMKKIHLKTSQNSLHNDMAVLVR